MAISWEKEQAFTEWNDDLEADLKLNPSEYWKEPKRHIDSSLTYPNSGGPRYVYYHKSEPGNRERLIRRPNMPQCPTVLQMDGRPVDYLEQKGFKRVWGEELRAICERQQSAVKNKSEDKKDQNNEAPKRGRPRSNY